MPEVWLARAVGPVRIRARSSRILALKIDPDCRTDGSEHSQNQNRILPVKKQIVGQIYPEDGNWSCCKNLHESNMHLKI
jgi:hypothetical protein